MAAAVNAKPQLCQVCGRAMWFGARPVTEPGICWVCEQKQRHTPAEIAEREARRRLMSLESQWKRDGVPARKRQQLLREAASISPHGTLGRLGGRMEEQRNELAIRDTEMLEIAERGFRPDQIEVIKNSLVPGIPDANLELFLQRCRSSRLNPLKSPPEIYCIPFQKNSGTKERPNWVKDYAAVASVDGMRAAALRTGTYHGQVGPLWCGPDGKWRDVWLEKTPPAACKVGVLIKGQPEPTWGVAVWEEMAAARKKNVKWAEMPARMLAIAAERMAIRRACPNVLDGIHVEGDVVNGVEMSSQNSGGTGELADDAVLDAECREEEHVPPPCDPHTGEVSPDGSAAIARDALYASIREASAAAGMDTSALAKWLETTYGVRRLGALPPDMLADVEAALRAQASAPDDSEVFDDASD